MGSYRPEIDGLRAIAIVSVVLFHANSTLLPGGYIGVDIFFVISGFLITSIVIKEQKAGQFSFLRFYERRARRILPALLFMLFVITLFCFAYLLPRDLVDYGRLLIYTVLFGANFRLATAPGYFQPSSRENPLLHMWSLAVEEQFYILWPALLLLVLLFCTVRQARYAAGALLLCSLALSAVLVSVLPRSAFYHLPSRAWELLAGAVLALGLLPPLTKRPAAELLTTAGLILIAVSMVAISEETPFPGLAALPPVIGAALIIYGTASVRTVTGSLLSFQPIVFVGLISYSLYLWHWPLISLAVYLSSNPLTQQEIYALVIAAIVISIISWRFVERPFRHPAPLTGMTRLFSSKGKRLAYAAMAVSAVLVGCGSFFQESKGAWWRVPKEVKSLLAEPVLASAGHRNCDQDTKHGGIFDQCQIGASGGRTGEVVIWGDSHAGHYSPALMKVLGGGTILIKFGCMPVPGISLSNMTAKFDAGCEQSRQVALSIIDKLKPKLVVLAGFWAVAEENDYLSTPRQVYLITKDDPAPSAEKTHTNFRTNFNALVQRLTASGAHVVILGQVPEWKSDVRKCVGLAVMHGRDFKKCLILERSKVEKNLRFINSTFSDAARLNPNVSVFFPIDEFCDEKYCRAERDGKLLYMDSSHISVNGSLYLVDAITRAIPDEFIRQAPSWHAAAAETP
jgi:peptidoglycan/LPS O-acetylase OafA/YrhL